MFHQALSLPQHPVWNAYKDEESKFLCTVRQVHIKRVPEASDKVSDYNSLKIGAKIAPHGNRGKDRNVLKSNSARFPPNGIRSIISI